MNTLGMMIGIGTFAAAAVTAAAVPHRFAELWKLLRGGVLQIKKVAILLDGLLARLISSALMWGMWGMAGLTVLTLITVTVHASSSPDVEMKGGWGLFIGAVMLAVVSFFAFWILREVQKPAVPQLLPGKFPKVLADDQDNVYSRFGGTAQIAGHAVTLDNNGNLVIGGGAVTIVNGVLQHNGNPVQENGVDVTLEELRSRLQPHPFAGWRRFNEQALDRDASRPVLSAVFLFLGFLFMGSVTMWLAAAIGSRPVALISMTFVLAAFIPLLVTIGAIRLIIPAGGKLERATDPLSKAPLLALSYTLSVYAWVFALPKIWMAAAASGAILSAMITYYVHSTRDLTQVKEWLRRASMIQALTLPPATVIGILLGFWNPAEHDYTTASLKQGQGHLQWLVLYWTGNETLFVNQNTEEMVWLGITIAVVAFVLLGFGKKIAPVFAEASWFRKIPAGVFYAGGVFAALQLFPLGFQLIAHKDGKNQFRMTNNIALADQSFEEAAAIATGMNEEKEAKIEAKKAAEEAAKKEKKAYAPSSPAPTAATTAAVAPKKAPLSKTQSPAPTGKYTPEYQEHLNRKAKRTALAQADVH